MGSDGVVYADECGDPATLLVAFLNTVDVEDRTDVLDDAETWTSWASERGLPATLRGEDLAGLRSLRDHLRAEATGVPTAPSSVAVTVLSDSGRARMGGSTASAVVAAAVAQVHLEGRLDRVKICPADDCRWAFYDASKNHSRQWCSMDVCGNRAKARAHRRRAAARPS